jgi:Dicer dimerisation domain
MRQSKEFFNFGPAKMTINDSKALLEYIFKQVHESCTHRECRKASSDETEKEFDKLRQLIKPFYKLMSDSTVNGKQQFNFMIITPHCIKHVLSSVQTEIYSPKKTEAEAYVALAALEQLCKKGFLD